MAEKAENEKKFAKGFPLPDFGGVVAEDTYFKMATLLGFYQKAVLEEDCLPALNDPEYFGLTILCRDTLRDLELLTYGSRPWTDTSEEQDS